MLCFVICFIILASFCLPQSSPAYLISKIHIAVFFQYKISSFLPLFVSLNNFVFTYLPTLCFLSFDGSDSLFNLTLSAVPFFFYSV